MGRPYSVSEMSKIDQKSLTHHARHLRLDTLVRLRWLAIVGQAVAVAGVSDRKSVV